jgi:hypothetical protein
MIPIAFVLAVAATLFVIVSLGQERVVQAMTGREPDQATIGAAFDLLGLALALVSVQTLLPALLLTTQRNCAPLSAELTDARV